MIKKVSGGYVVVSHRTGKRLSRVYRSKSQAQRRLKQIQYFKYAKSRRRRRNTGFGSL